MTQEQADRIEDKLDWLIGNQADKTVNPDPVPPPRPKK